MVGIPAPRTAGRDYSAPVLRRHAPAHHDRHGDRARARAAHRRRADDRPRRHRPGADPRAPRPAAARARHGACCSSRTISASSRGRRPGRRHVRGPDRRVRQRRRPATTSPPTRTPRRCCEPIPRHGGRPAPTCGRSPARRRARSRCRSGCAVPSALRLREPSCAETTVRPPLAEAGPGHGARLPSLEEVLAHDRPTDAVLSVDAPGKVVLAIRAGRVLRPDASGCSVDRSPTSTASTSLRRARRSGIVGESGCGKSTLARHARAASRCPTPGTISFRGRDVTAAPRRPHAGRAAARHPDGLPGPLHLARPADDRAATSSPSRWSAHRRRRAEATAEAASASCSTLVGPHARLHRPLPAPVLRRAAAAHRHRPRACARAHGPGLRRAGLRARRVGAGPGVNLLRDLQRRLGLAYCSSPTTCRWSGTSPTASR